MLPEISIIIVNYNTADLLPACLDSIFAQSEQVSRVIVVDNNSADNSVELVASQYPSVRLIANTKNLGFSAANNQALAECDTDLVFFLNPDTALHQNCLVRIRKYMKDNQKIGLAGVEIVNQQGGLHDSIEYCYPGNNYARDTLGQLPGDIAWVLGAGMVGRLAIMRELQGFDERFFLYAEDIDLCLRVRQTGWQVGYVNKARITHIEGQSERGVDYYRVTEKKSRAELLFFHKHYPDSVIDRIRRARKVQALWRIFCLTCFPGLSERKQRVNKDKLLKYKAIFSIYRKAVHSSS